MNALIYLQVISTQKIIFQGNVTVARFPGKKSAFSVMKDHAPILSLLEKGFITFVEFKYGKINEIDFRLKFTESLISFIDYSIDNKLINNITFPNKYFKFYIVYKFKSATFDIEMNRIQRKLKSQYKYFVSNYTIISNDKFKKIYL